MFVDQPISLTWTRKTAYPDIALVSAGEELRQVIDVKMDFGWNRDGMLEFCQGKSPLVHALRGSRVRLKEGITKKPLELLVSPKCSYHLVIVSGENISETKLQFALSTAKQFEPEIVTYLLSDGIHPNHYELGEEEVVGKLDIKDDAFELLVNNLTD